MAKYRKLSRTSSQRKALLRGQVTALLASENGRIVTTEAKAKEVRKIVDGLIAMAVKSVPTETAGRKRNTKEVDLVDKLFTEIAPKYADRNGGYTRIVKIGQRKGDGALEVLLELV